MSCQPDVPAAPFMPYSAKVVVSDECLSESLLAGRTGCLSLSLSLSLCVCVCVCVTVMTHYLHD